MGCINSKLRADDVVGRCKVRKKLMKQAVEQRHAFAAAHAAYVQALRNTGSALRQFAEGEGGLPASGPGPFARIPEPPPPPPPMHPPSALSGPPSPLVQASTPTLTLDSPVRKAWDFFVPFDPSEPPLHLQEQRKMVVQKKGADDDDDADKKQSTPNIGNVSQADENQSSLIVLQNKASQGSLPVTDAPVETSNEKRDEHCGDSSEHDEMSKHLQSIAESSHVQPSTEKDPTEGITREEPLDEGSIEHELGFMLRPNVKKDLPTIARELDEEFLKASTGAASVAVALEIRKPHLLTAQPKRKFRKYNSARVFSAFNWNWSRNPLSAKEELESNLDESGRNTSHALTLERLLAWEKKLFEEVKAVESLSTEREKKCSRLRRQEMKGEDASEIEKTRVDIKRMYSLIMVSYQRVDSTVEAIEDLRDDELHPQLVGLIDGLMNMWTAMHLRHARQTQIIVHIKCLDAVMSREPTSESHHQATIQLEKELLGWHESFCKLVASQRGYMAALYGWLTLSLMPIPTGKEKKRISEEDAEEGKELEIFKICEEWQRALGCLPDKVASEAIKSLAEVVKAMVGKQGEEMKQRKKVEKLEKLWEKKARALQPWEEEEEEEEKSRRRGRREDDDDADDDAEERRASRMIPAIGLKERREAVAAMKKKVEGEMMKHGRAVQDTRVLTMNNLQTGLPGVLEAMTGFSAVCSQAFQQLHSLTRFSNSSN